MQHIDNIITITVLVRILDFCYDASIAHSLASHFIMELLD